MSEQEDFLKDTETDVTKVDVLEAPLNSQGSEKGEGTEAGEGAGKGADNDGEEFTPKNRRERRLMKQLQDEREGSIFMAGKLEARTEAQKAVTEEADYLKAVERIYGTDTPEAQLATDLLKKAFVGARDDAEKRAYERVKEDQRKAAEDEKKAEDELDNILDEIEDEHGVTLTETQEKAFFLLLEKMSPKDKHGAVTDYADPHAVWEVFAEKLKKPSSGNTRAKDLSSRSMVNSGSSKESNLEGDATARYLQEQGII